MSRCTRCNGKFIQKPLSTEEAIEAAKGFQRIPNCLFDKNLEFWQCMDCHQLYWEVLFISSVLLCIALLSITNHSSLIGIIFFYIYGCIWWNSNLSDMRILCREPNTIMQYRSSLTFASWVINLLSTVDVHLSDGAIEELSITMKMSFSLEHILFQCNLSMWCILYFIHQVWLPHLVPTSVALYSAEWTLTFQWGKSCMLKLEIFKNIEIACVLCVGLKICTSIIKCHFKAIALPCP